MKHPIIITSSGEVIVNKEIKLKDYTYFFTEKGIYYLSNSGGEYVKVEVPEEGSFV